MKTSTTVGGALLAVSALVVGGLLTVGGVAVAPSALSATYPPDPPTSATATPSSSPTPTPTPTPSPTPNPNVTPPETGEASITVGGQTVTIETTTNASRGTTNIDAGIFELEVQPKNLSGGDVPFDDAGSMVVFAGGAVQATGRGFEPATVVNFYILLGGGRVRFIGQLNVLPSGTFGGNVPVPTDLAPGTYALQVSGIVSFTGTIVNAVRARAAVEPTPRVVVVTLQVVAEPPPRQSRLLRTAVFFDILSSRLTKDGKAALRQLAKKIPDRRAKNRVTVVGFVGIGGPAYNNQSLSLARARSTARYLRALGVRGVYVVSGAGLSTQQGIGARRANVVVRTAP